MADDQLLPDLSDHTTAIHHSVPIAHFLLPTFSSIKITPSSRCCQTCYMASIIPEHFVPFPCGVQFILHIYIFNNVLRMLSCRIVHQAVGKCFVLLFRVCVCSLCRSSLSLLWQQLQRKWMQYSRHFPSEQLSLPKVPAGSIPHFPHLQSLWMFLETVTWP